MTALIPAIGTCSSRMTSGERRFARRLEEKLEDDWLAWYDVPLGPRNVHPKKRGCELFGEIKFALTPLGHLEMIKTP